MVVFRLVERLPKPVERLPMLLVVVLNPAAVDVDKLSMLLVAVLRPVDRLPILLAAVFRLVKTDVDKLSTRLATMPSPVEVEVDRLATELFVAIKLVDRLATLLFVVLKLVDNEAVAVDSWLTLTASVGAPPAATLVSLRSLPLAPTDTSPAGVAPEIAAPGEGV